MKINRYNGKYYSRLNLTANEHDIQIQSVTLFGQESYAVVVSGIGTRYFDTVAAALDYCAEFLSADENREVLEYFAEYRNPNYGKIEVC